MTETLTQLETDLQRFLPAQLLESLDTPESLRAALQHLNSLERAVVSFLPSYIAEDRTLFGESAEAATRDVGMLRAGIFMFADVSGFTALSEKLQQRSGAVGTEVLTAVINQYFEIMLEILAKSEGTLLKFAGDALLAFFPQGRNPENMTPALQAIRSGLRMQRAMREKFQPIRHEQLTALLGDDHQSSLTMSIGIAKGRLFEALVGTMTQRDHIIQGTLPGEAMDAEGVGERDEVIVPPDIADAFRDRFRFKPLDEGYFQVIDDVQDLDDFETTLLQVRRRQGVAAGLLDLEQENLHESLQKQIDKVRRVSLFVPPSVLGGLIHSEDLHLPRENRYTVTMFIHATGFAELLHDWGEDQLQRITNLLDRYYSLVQRVTSQYGGTLTRTDPYKLGFKLLTTYGAPIQHTDDPYRAVSAALEMNHALEQFNLRVHEELPAELRRPVYVEQRIGITVGETFSGEAGWKQRREYTVMGDDVNLAARLMAYAKFGQILVSSRIYKQVSSFFKAEAQAPISLKGKKAPIDTYLVSDTLESAGMLEAQGEMPFIGHELFMLKLDLLLQQARFGKVKALALVGDAGIGKTRIARQFAEMARAAKFRVAWVTCQARSRRALWATLAAQLLDVDLNGPPDEARRQFEAAVSDAKFADVRRPLSNLLFGFTPAETKSSPPPSAPAAPAERPKLNDMFAMVQAMSKDEMKKSGMFGLMRRTLESSAAEDTSASKSGFYASADKATSFEYAIMRLVMLACAAQPTLLVLDDLQNATDDSVNILRRALKEMTRGQLVVLMTYEPMSVSLDVKSEVVPDLGEDETLRVAMANLHASDLGPRLRTLLWQRTSGRPLYIESLIRTLQDNQFIEMSSGVAELTPGADVDALPDDVRQMVVSRVDRLSPDAQSLVRVAAVLGFEITRHALETIGEYTDADQFARLMDELIQSQIIESDGSDQYEFRHGMTGSVIYGTLSRAQRAKLHRTAAEYYRQRAQESAGMAVAAGYHLSKCGLLPRAIELLQQVADEAEAGGKLAMAHDIIRYAVSLMPDDHTLNARLQTLDKSASGL
ncbi:MAG: AAA family ATPase [Pleurocapsa minor GSE-CHR-MK-17-07R]|jgi:class 3 adenylate cyclase/uncharacterized protein YggL (DUF469 family)|nr:AAA family ATPase [Pleurocapsa minor GSE-CHR-MK 17-07R]